MAPSLLDTFRVLASFSPSRTSLRGAPWEEYVDWAIAQGLAPLAAYNLEYRLGGGGAPEWARDRLLSIYQGSLNDNVMKLVNFKRAVDELEGRRIVLLGAASYAESLYPHVAFRPVLDLDLLLPASDLDGFAGFLGQSEFKPVASHPRLRVLSDGRTQITLHGSLLGPGFEGEDRALLDRALPVRAFGPSFFRLTAEDALLGSILDQAHAGYSVPTITFVDLRELLLGAPSMQGAYSRALDLAVLRSRAERWRIQRAVHASTRIVAALFPETVSVVESLTQDLRPTSRALLDGLVVRPLAELGRMRETRGAERLRRLLTGGRSPRSQ
jgi:putative nucleotidyltransferase-like protein